MPFSFSAGLSGMGASIASTAQTMVLENQRDALETRKIQLANDLQTQRETTLAGVQHGYREQEQQTAGQIQAGLIGTQATSNVAQAQQIAENANKLVITNSNDPKYLAGLKNIATASAGPAQTAEAVNALATAALTNLNVKNAQAITDTRNLIIDEQAKANPNPNTLRTLQNKFNTLTTDPEIQQKWATAMTANERAVADEAGRMQSRLTQLTLEMDRFAQDPEGRKVIEAERNDVKAQLDNLNAASEQARAMANQALGGTPSQQQQQEKPKFPVIQYDNQGRRINPNTVPQWSGR
jgi:hypothetical protein